MTALAGESLIFLTYRRLVDILCRLLAKRFKMGLTSIFDVKKGRLKN